jgi:O-antigen/teichoic acid export membrane protein
VRELPLTAPAAAAAGAAHVLDSPESTRRVIRGGLVRTAGYAMSVLAGIAALPFLFRHLGVVDTGRYVIVVTVVTLVGSIVEAGFSAVSVREFAVRPADEQPALMRDLIGLRLAVFSAGAVIALIFMLCSGYPAILVAGAGFALVGAAMENVSSTYGVWLSTSLNLGWLAAMQVVRQLVAVALTVVLVIVRAPLVYFFALLVLAGAAQFAIGLWATRGVIPHVPALRPRRWKELARRSAPYIAAMALGVVYFRTAMILMPLLSSDRETGYLGVPFRILEIITLVSVLLMSSAFPILARAAGRDRARHRYALARLTDVALIVGGAVALVAYMGAGPIVALLAGDGFERAGVALEILSVSLAFKFVIAAWSLALLSLDEYRGVLVANAAAMAVALAATLVAVPPLGATGGAIATAACDLVLVAGYGVLLVRRGITLPWRTAGSVAIAGATAAGLAVALPMTGSESALLGGATYLGVLAVLDAYPHELRQALPGGGRTS